MVNFPHHYCIKSIANIFSGYVEEEEGSRQDPRTITRPTTDRALISSVGQILLCSVIFEYVPKWSRLIYMLFRESFRMDKTSS